jgi:hypothetical protein
MDRPTEMDFGQDLEWSLVLISVHMGQARREGKVEWENNLTRNP